MRDERVRLKAGLPSAASVRSQESLRLFDKGGPFEPEALGSLVLVSTGHCQGSSDKLALNFGDVSLHVEALFGRWHGYPSS